MLLSVIENLLTNYLFMKEQKFNDKVEFVFSFFYIVIVLVIIVIDVTNKNGEGNFGIILYIAAAPLLIGGIGVAFILGKIVGKFIDKKEKTKTDTNN